MSYVVSPMRTAALLLLLCVTACGPSDVTVEDFAEDESGETLGALGVMRISAGCRRGLVLGRTVADLSAATAPGTSCPAR